ncbi:MAG TPA: ABC-2 family transporter protein [Ktedonobacteraceae bacterium]|nr:ABC-2 family transporter protein [Ktedonobacteraceae bacterium]
MRSFLQPFQSLRLLWVFFRISLLNEAAYRANFFMQVLQSLINLATSLVLLLTIFSYTSALNGWRPAELLALVGVYFLMGGLMNVVLQPSMSRFMKDIRMGTLDYTLTKPEDAQVLVSMQQVEIWRLVDVLLGIVIIIVAMFWRGTIVNAWEILGFVATLIAGAMIIYSFLLVLATISFWYVKVDNILVIFQSMYEAGRWPVTIYPGWLRIILTFIVPVAFAITVPASALVGQLTWYILLGAVILAIVALLGARSFWRIGLRHYTGASA